MTKEQLQAARAAHWRQKQNPILTLEDAESWVEQHPLCLYLPRQAQLPAPAPSFVEACMGSGHTTPGAAAIEQARDLLTRLIASGNVVALNLFGAVGEQPDFLVARQALPFVLALRGDPDWKHAPQKSSGHKVTPLVLEIWKALEQEGGLTAAEVREKLGRELTEAAVLRGLSELWQGLRISPVFGGSGEPARWELLRLHHRDALATATSTAQVTALSLLVSMYLQSVYAASSEEIEVFLSPVASRSRVREAVRGLSATRQIHSLSMDAQTYYFLENGLPEFAEPAAPPVERNVEERRAEAPRRPWSPAGLRPGPQPGRPIPAPAARKAQGARPVRPISGPVPAQVAPKARPAQPWQRKTEWKARPPAAGSEKSLEKSPFRGSKTARPGIRPEQRPESRPGARSGERPRDPKRSGPTPWPRPERSAAAPRAPGDSAGRPSRAPSRPRPGSPEGRPSASGGAPKGAGRERFPGRPSRPFRPDTRPDTRPAPPAATRPGPRPFSRAGSRPDSQTGPPPAARPGPRTGSRPESRPGSRPGPRRGPGFGSRPDTRSSPRPGPRPGQRPFSRAGSRPDARPGPRPDSQTGPRPSGTRPGGERPSSSRPSSSGRPSSARPRPSSGGPGRGGPPKSWPRAGDSAKRPGRKPGKSPANFRGRKPDRNKPGA
jgi:23S rRNA pseudouridine2605 synthase